MLSPAQTQHIVLEKIRELTLPGSAEPAPSTLFADLGLDSLTMARLFIQLEQTIGVDPLAGVGFSLGAIRTIGDLVDACLAAVADGELEPKQA